MATYKLIQDIEAEDHILGPLTLRQFIYALIGAFCAYMTFIGIAKHIWPLLVIFLPVMLLTGFFAFPFGKDQPTEIWALAKIRFLFKPRRRIWDQSGIREMVTITAPKKEDPVLTDGLSQTEVKSRLRALADTIDSRGWAIKNVNVNLYSQPSPLLSGSSDRLIDLSSMPQQVPDYEVTASDDILDEQSNPIAQQFSQMINATAQSHRQQLINNLNDSQPLPPGPQTTPADYWFLNQAAPSAPLPADSAVFQPQVVLPGTADDTATMPADATPDEAAVIARAKKRGSSQNTSYAHLKTIQPLGGAPPAPATDTNVPDTAPRTPDPAILSLANNNDLNVATLAREAKRATGSDDEGEVVVPLR